VAQPVEATDLVVQPVCATGHRTHALTVSDGATEDGTGRGTLIVPHAVLPFDTTQITSPSNYSRPKAGDPCHPLAAGAHAPAIAFHPTQDPISSVEVTHALGTGSKGGCATYLATIEVTGTLSSRATADGGLGTDFEVTGGLQPAYIDALQDCSPSDTLALEGLSHADATQADARKVLRTVLDEIGAEAFTVWGLGVAASLQSPEVLQHYLHGESVRREAATQYCVGGVSLSLAEDGAAGTLRGLREAGCARRSPCRWESHEQRHQELAAYLSGLSHPSASWRQVVQGVRQTVETLRILHDARSSIQEMGRSDDRQGQSVCISTEGHGVESDSVVRCLRLLEEASREWLLRDTRTTSETRKAVMACRRLLPIETERLQGFPDDWTNIPWRGKPAPDSPRYKAMGNSMAVPVMRWIGERLDRVAKGKP